MKPIDREIVEQLYDPPPRWFRAMYEGIRKRSDVRNPGTTVRSIWSKLPARKRLEIKKREEKGAAFKYDLPLPEDHPTKGTGTVRLVKPFNLVEGQANVSPAVYARLEKSGLFARMKRQDGTTALVKRCKSKKGNCNIFIDKMR